MSKRDDVRATVAEATREYRELLAIAATWTDNKQTQRRMVEAFFHGRLQADQIKRES